MGRKIVSWLEDGKRLIHACRHGASLIVMCSLGASAAPINWEIQMVAFEKIYQPHPHCASGQMSQMDCSNFRARALKRFTKEWADNSFWEAGRYIENAAANRRVNAEFPRGTGTSAR